MSNEIEYVRINCSLAWRMGIDYFITENGIVATPEFMSRLRAQNEIFNSRLLQPIIDRIGNDGWALHFIQIYRKGFFADIYVDNIINFDIIRDVCESFSGYDYQLSYYYRGKVYDYLNP